METITAILAGTWMAVAGFFGIYSEEPVGAETRVFVSAQVGTDPTADDCLQTNGATSTWSPCPGAAGGDSLSIDSVAVVDPDFVSTGDIDFIDTSNTVTADINAGSIVGSDLSTTTTFLNTELLSYVSATDNFTSLTCAEITGSADLCDGSDDGGGGGGSGNVATSTADTDTHIAFFTSTNATPATIGGEAAFTYDDATNLLTVTNASSTLLTVSGTIWGDLTGDVTGNADTATALAANGANCSAGNAPLGVDASGAVESCFDVWTEAENTSAS